MRYEITKHQLVVFLDNPDRRTAHALDLSFLLALPPALIRRLLDATIARVQGKRYKTQAGYLRCSVSKFGRFVEARGISELPTHFDDWQNFILDFYIWFLSTGRYKATLVTRSRIWDQTASCWLCMLGEEGILPRGLMIPKSSLPRMLVEHGTALWPRSIGDAPAVSTNSAPIGRTLYGPIFWTTDADALEMIRQTMESRLGALDLALDDYWLRKQKDRRIGRRLIKPMMVWVEECVKNRAWAPLPGQLEQVKGFRPSLATHPNIPGSEAATLGVLAFILRYSTDVSCLSPAALQRHPAFSTRFAHKRLSTSQDLLYVLSSLTEHQQKLQTVMTLYKRFLGILNPLDMAVAVAILIRENPNFNPESLMSARLLNARGRTYLLMTDRAGRAIFSVDKPRAGSRKYSVLSRRSTRVIKQIVLATQSVREVLERSGSKFWRHLFVGSAGRELGHPELTARLLNGSTKYSLVSYYPELEVHGLTQGTLDFAKIRATVGMLTWFETGSVVLMSRKLGNTNRVALENYIPKEIRRLWNERIVRRFQNVLIVLASANREYSLRVSDLATVQDLNSFLAQITHDFAPGSSAIANEIERQYAGRFQISLNEPGGEKKAGDDELLSIMVGADALFYLYERRLEWELDRSSHGRRREEELVDLAALLHLVAMRPEVAARVMGIVCSAQLHRAHSAAITRLKAVRQASAETAILSGWESI